MEYWLRGPVDKVPDLLQPVAHALLQAREEVEAMSENFPPHLLWKKPAGLASVGFHLQHLTGVLDRLFTYARGKQLSTTQMDYLAMEGKQDLSIQPDMLRRNFDNQVGKAIMQLKDTDTDSLIETRGVGRKHVPSTVIGLLFHAAEHIMRHTGQLLVTIKIVLSVDSQLRTQW